jgi:hypothetical protein
MLAARELQGTRPRPRTRLRGSSDNLAEHSIDDRLGDTPYACAFRLPKSDGAILKFIFL